MIIAKLWQPVQPATVKRHRICAWYSYLLMLQDSTGIHYYGLTKRRLKPEIISPEVWEDNEAYAAKAVLERLEKQLVEPSNTSLFA